MRRRGQRWSNMPSKPTTSIICDGCMKRLAASRLANYREHGVYWYPMSQHLARCPCWCHHHV